MIIVMYASFMSMLLHAGVPKETGGKKRKIETKISKQGDPVKGDYDWLRLLEGSRDGAVVRVLTSHQCWVSLISGLSYMG